MRARLIMVALVAVAVGAGCGGDEASQPEAGSTSTLAAQDVTKTPERRAAYIEGYIVGNVKPTVGDDRVLFTGAACRPYPKASLFICDVRLASTAGVGGDLGVVPFLAYMPRDAEEPDAHQAGGNDGSAQLVQLCDVNVDACLRLVRGSAGDDGASRPSAPTPDATPPEPEPEPEGDGDDAPSSGRSAPPRFIQTPTRNVICQLDATQALCTVISSERQGTLTSDGDLEIAKQSSNPPIEGIATLGYGESASRGSLRCTSARAGMRCATDDGIGFVASREGIRRL